MKSLKASLLKRKLAIVLIVLLVFTVFDTIYIFTQTSLLQGPVNNSNYDFIVYKDGDVCKAKNVHTNAIAVASTNASEAINYAIDNGKTIHIQQADYTLTGDILVNNKINLVIDSNNAQLIGNLHKIIIRGDNYTYSKYVSIAGLTITNATLHIENSFGVTVSDMIFQDCPVGIELANTNTWTEDTEIEECHFINCAEGIAFRTPVQNGTGSYASSQINRCFFNLKDNSTAINVEMCAEFSNSQMQNIRVWAGENGVTNQTGLYVNGSMSQTLLIGVVFESFASYPYGSFAIDIGEACNPAPTLYGGVDFLGNWTARIHNPYYKWINGVGSIFERQNITVPVGVNNQYGENITITEPPLTITSFKPEIDVSGSFGSGEIVTVRVRFEYVDNSYSNSVTKTFTNGSSVWLTDDDLMQLMASQSVIWAVIIDAKSSSASSNVAVSVSGYGTAG